MSDRNSAPSALRRLGLVVLVSILWGLFSGLIQTVVFSALIAFVDSARVQVAVLCVVQFLAAFGAVRTLVRWDGETRVAWLGVALFATIEIVRLLLLFGGIGGWANLDQATRLELLVRLATPQFFAILGAWLGQRSLASGIDPSPA